MINNITLVGRLTKEPELKYTPSGVAVCTFTLAVNRSFTNQQGEKEADFINIKVWRKPAENAANFLKKGHLAGIVGRLETGSYEGSDGKRVYTTEVIADQVQFLEPKRDNQSQGQQGQQNQNQQQSNNQSYGQGQQQQSNNHNPNQQQGSFRQEQQSQYAGAGVGGQQHNNGNQQFSQQQGSPFSSNGPGTGYSDDDLPF